MIDVCAGRYKSSTPPLVRCSSDDRSQIVVLFDGSGSWGTGAEAAAWCRESLAANLAVGPDFTHTEFTQALEAAAATLSDVTRANEWGWSFSVAAIVIRDSVVYGLAAGGFSIGLLREGAPMRRLFAPDRLVDELVRTGQLSHGDAKTSTYRRILLSPCFGDKPDALRTRAQEALQPGDRVILGDPDLLDLLATLPPDAPVPRAIELRDRVEQLGGQSCPTAVLLVESFPHGYSA
ncbi:hypothetical protein [Sorangium sp. So ce1153]|uniref:hypothetical protein n=1 Tax=Sorangium sp. So ce1153 TaxID=3133333 RepID=UPI003F5DB73B